MSAWMAHSFASTRHSAASLAGIVRRCWVSAIVGSSIPTILAQDAEQKRALLAGDIARFTLEQRYIRPDGTTLWGNLTVSLVRDKTGAPAYFIAVIEDISARRRAEDALREREALFASLIADAPAGIAVFWIATCAISPRAGAS